MLARYGCRAVCCCGIMCTRALRGRIGVQERRKTESVFFSFFFLLFEKSTSTASCHDAATLLSLLVGSVGSKLGEEVGALLVEGVPSLVVESVGDVKFADFGVGKALSEGRVSVIALRTNEE